MLRTGTAHYNCHVSGIVLVKNPRPALYINSLAYTMDQNPCVTEHKLDNSLIEIYGCDMVSSVHRDFKSLDQIPNTLTLRPYDQGRLLASPFVNRPVKGKECGRMLEGLLSVKQKQRG